MRHITSYTPVLLSLGLMAAFSYTFGQGESPSAGDTKVGYGSAVSSPQPADAKTAASAAPDAGKTADMEVKLKEFTIEMSDSISAGPTTFKVTNTGKETHGFKIEGNGIEKALKPTLKKGGSGSLQVDLKPGSYKAYCPVKGHKVLGMSLTLTVK